MKGLSTCLGEAAGEDDLAGIYSTVCGGTRGRIVSEGDV